VIDQRIPRPHEGDVKELRLALVCEIHRLVRASEAFDAAPADDGARNPSPARTTERPGTSSSIPSRPSGTWASATTSRPFESVPATPSSCDRRVPPRASSRACRSRQNDYLWGRLDGAERLIDLLLYRLPEGPGQSHRALKLDAIAAVLDEESGLRHSLPDVFATLEDQLRTARTA